MSEWCQIIYMQGEECDEFQRVLDEDGAAAAVRYLAQWDYGRDSEGHVVAGEPERMPSVIETDGYLCTYDAALRTAALYRRTSHPSNLADWRVALWEAGDGHKAGCPACGQQALRLVAESPLDGGYGERKVRYEWECPDCGLLWEEERVYAASRSELSVHEHGRSR